MDTPIIEVNHVSYKYPTAAGWVLEDIAFSVDKGEILGIIGPTGAGKTTLAMCMRGLIPYNVGGTFGGRIFVNGQDTLAMNPGELADKIGIVFQNAETQAIGLTVIEDLAFGLENLNLAPDVMEDRINRVSRVVGLEGFLDRETFALSGGQKQRLAIGGVLVMEPDILILDEPTAELDPVGKTEVFEIVRSLQQDRNLTIVMVEHEVETLAEVADRILVLEGGKVIALASTKEIFKRTDLFNQVRERVPFAAKLAIQLIEKRVLSERQFTCVEDELIRLIRDLVNNKKVLT